MLTTPDALRAELHAELRNHAYGIKAYTIPAIPDSSRSPDTALQQQRPQSTIQLLQSDDSSPSTITVALDATRGYVVTSCSPPQTALVDRQFESLTGLLSELSPEFRSAMHTTLSARLFDLLGATTEQQHQQREDDNSYDSPE
ncbi:hypothetical protein GGI07_002297 [Coemansia sp. Benny D115]|nr:hypothetical protein GGI07_002297 [Coemansia sp. Benny D115]